MKSTKNISILEHLLTLEAHYLNDYQDYDPYKQRLLDDIRRKIESLQKCGMLLYTTPQRLEE